MTVGKLWSKHEQPLFPNSLRGETCCNKAPLEQLVSVVLDIWPIPDMIMALDEDATH